MKTLFIFLDESGNMDFSRRGTAHFVLAAVTALQPLESSRRLQKLKYSLLEQGKDIEQFHASEDKQIIRNQVFALLNQIDNIHVNFIHADKHKTPPKYQGAAQFYGLLGKKLLKNIFSSYAASHYDENIIIFDKALTRKEQNAFLKAVKPELKQLGKPFKIYFHRTLSDFNGQIADYLAWAFYVSLERNEQRPIKALQSLKKVDFDIFSNQEKKYY